MKKYMKPTMELVRVRTQLPLALSAFVETPEITTSRELDLDQYFDTDDGSSWFTNEELF